MRAALKKWWAREPVRIVSQTGAALALASSLGFTVSDQGSAALMAVASAIAALGGGEFIRSKVTPAGKS